MKIHPRLDLSEVEVNNILGRHSQRFLYYNSPDRHSVPSASSILVGSSFRGKPVNSEWVQVGDKFLPFHSRDGVCILREQDEQ